MKLEWNKSEDDGSKKKENVVLNILKVEKLAKLEQIYFTFSLMARNPKISTEIDLEMCKKLFLFKYQGETKHHQGYSIS